MIGATVAILATIKAPIAAPMGRRGDPLEIRQWWDLAPAPLPQQSDMGDQTDSADQQVCSAAGHAANDRGKANQE